MAMLGEPFGILAPIKLLNDLKELYLFFQRFIPHLCLVSFETRFPLECLTLVRMNHGNKNASSKWGKVSKTVSRNICN